TLAGNAQASLSSRGYFLGFPFRLPPLTNAADITAELCLEPACFYPVEVCDPRGLFFKAVASVAITVTRDLARPIVPLYITRPALTRIPWVPGLGVGSSATAGVDNFRLAAGTDGPGPNEGHFRLFFDATEGQNCKTLFCDTETRVRPPRPGAAAVP